MPRDRLQTALWVGATLRRVNAAGGFAAILNKGEAESGVLIVRIALLDGTSLLVTEARDLDGALDWMAPLGPDPLPDAKVDGYIARAIERDPDLWAVEVEDKTGANPFAA